MNFFDFIKEFLESDLSTNKIIVYIFLVILIIVLTVFITNFFNKKIFNEIKELKNENKELKNENEELKNENEELKKDKEKLITDLKEANKKYNDLNAVNVLNRALDKKDSDDIHDKGLINFTHNNT